ncbi:hypothetical protein OPT61_g9929 [Boeremia exigua]|uniref:Uncharacterized protein n=1 Tax=Boeremia exigua TaxID=749465 RepID=A0ACC2HSX0_9PLEO|nr:hypothetical protein OPT61_g9929 [Boeremia exigua]
MPEAFHAPLAEEDVEAVRAEKTVFIGGVSLEGQTAESEQPGSERRQAFAMHQIATGRVIKTIWPPFPADLECIDPVLNVSANWPPTAIVHGTADVSVPMHLSKVLERELRDKGVETAFF